MTRTLCPPAAAAAAMLHRLFPASEVVAIPGLADFQRDAVTRLTAILKRYRGALLCDSVGLGKTHVAAQIASDALSRGESLLVSAPAHLRPHWTRQLQRIGRWNWVSHTTLSRRSAAERLYARPFDLVLVDEAHAFRNDATRRYDALARIALRARVLLITATPVNNSLRDFHNLLRLFAADDEFTDIGIASLRNALEAAECGVTTELRRIAQHVMVRRTRDAVRRWSESAGAGTVAAAAGRFPAAHCTELVDYDLPQVYEGRLEEILVLIAALRFAAHGVVSAGPARELMRLSLIKRLESSTVAFSGSIERLERLNAVFAAAAEAGLLFEPGRDGSLASAVDGAMQLSMPELALPPWPSWLDRARSLRRARHDAARLRELRQAARLSSAAPDAKAAALVQLLAGTLVDDKVVVFSEYRDTASFLWRALERQGGIALVHGGVARLGRRRTSRRIVVERFAPLANGARHHPRVEDVRVLITTDVLSEGMNLQDARAVISYDLPWNPVRLAQRAGRIDRLGSPHDHIRIFAFRPDRGVERVLGLMRRVREKLRAIRIVGGDAPAPFPRRRTLHERLHNDMRELVRMEFLRRRPVPCAGACRSVCSWSEPMGAVLCCVLLGHSAALVLVPDDGESSVDADSAWNALMVALSSTTSVAGDDVPHAVFTRAEAIAMRIATRGRHAVDTVVGDTTRQRAARTVRSWLAARPGEPDATDFARADAALELLRASGPAGTEALIRDCLACDDRELVVSRLLALPAPSDAERNRQLERPQVVAAIRFVPVDRS